MKLQKAKWIKDEENFQGQLYDIVKKVSTKDQQGEDGQGDVRGAFSGQDKTGQADGKPVRPKGRLYKGTPFLRGNTEDKM